MDQNTKTTLLIIDQYRRQLSSMGIHCKKILLFGSHLHNKAREGSDIDLIVISEDWVSFSRRERFELLGVAAARILQPVQSVGFTPAEIEHDDLPFFWKEMLAQAQAA